MSYQRLLFLATLCAIVAFLTLVIRVGHPHHRQLALAIYGIGWVPFLLSIRQFWFAHDVHFERLLPWKNHIAVGIGLLFFMWAFKVLIPTERSPLLELDWDQLPATLDADLQTLALVDDKIQSIAAALRTSPLIGEVQFSANEAQELRAMWAQFIEASFELELLKARYRAFYQVNGFTHPKPHAQAFLVAYGAFVSQYRAASIVTARISEFEATKKLLDDAQPRAGIPAGSFARVQMLVTHPDEILRLNAGRAYLQLMKRRLERGDPNVLRAEGQLSEITDLVFSDTDTFINNPLDILEHEASNAWYPVQKGVALSIASVRTVSRDYFISSKDIIAEEDTLLPGDILLTRREWHLTNLGIPGYWTHAAFYLGSLDRIDDYFADLALLEGRPPSDVLRDRFPKVFRAMAGKDPTGETPSVIEALRPGVIVQSLSGSAAADSLAVLRPKVTKADRWQAILSALPHYGKPYNYQFDFRTDSALLCSQLVCKAFEEIRGVRLEPAMSRGRLLLSPNEIAIKYDNEFAQENAELDLVLFLDGSDVGKVVKRGVADFRRSWTRPKWHIVFEGD